MTTTALAMLSSLEAVPSATMTFIPLNSGYESDHVRRVLGGRNDKFPFHPLENEQDFDSKRPILMVG